MDSKIAHFKIYHDDSKRSEISLIDRLCGMTNQVSIYFSLQLFGFNKGNIVVGTLPQTSQNWQYLKSCKKETIFY